MPRDSVLAILGTTHKQHSSDKPKLPLAKSCNEGSVVEVVADQSSQTLVKQPW